VLKKHGWGERGFFPVLFEIEPWFLWSTLPHGIYHRESAGTFNAIELNSPTSPVESRVWIMGQVAPLSLDWARFTPPLTVS
jgi:hypothetical protein